MRNLRRIIVLTGIGAVLAIPTAAVAVPYPAPPAGVTVSPAAVTVGGTVVFAATGGFIPGERVAIDVRYDSQSSAARQGVAGMDPSVGRIVAVSLPTRLDQTVIANGAGGFSATVRLTRVGTAILTATGLDSGVSVSVAVSVLAEVDSDLPVTGSSGLRLALQVGAGAVALFLGTLLVWLVADRRRRTAKV